MFSLVFHAPLILAPGVGPQGAQFGRIENNFGPAMGRTLPSVSRSILRHGPSPAALREAIDRYQEQGWRAAEISAIGIIRRVASRTPGLRPMLPFAFPVEPDVKH